ncbi:MAG: substrate-binding domain-containing protein [Syntrophomonadaceae bacterium]|nr:substrate-binding domain-containing protein [Syntrophomonadaceae bacterium]
MLKKVTVLLVCLSLLIVAGGCSKKEAESRLLESNSVSSASANDNASQDKKNIALVMKNLTNPFFVEMEKGARQAEKDFNINLIVKTGDQETSVDQQINIVEALIKEKVDAIVIAPGGSTELIPVLKKAQDAHIVVVNVDNRLDKEQSVKLGLNDVPFIGVNNVQGAYLSAKYISDKLTKPTRVVVIEGIISAQNSQDRKIGAFKAFQENRYVISIAMETANWKMDESYEVTKKLFAQYPDIGAIFCANDMMALGTIKYLKDSHRNNVLVAGFDALAEAQDAVRNGQLMVTIDRQPGVQGYMGVKYALDRLNNIPVETNHIIDIKVITKNKI